MNFKGFGVDKTETSVTQKRHKYVGGSDVPTILGINKYKTQFQLAKEKTGLETVEFITNPYIQYGNQLEPQIREYINAAYQKNFIVDSFIDEERNIRSNVDGIDMEEKQLLEIKTHGKNPTMQVYKAQMQLYMWQTGATEGLLALYSRPEDFDIEFDSNRLDIIVVERDDEYIEKILDSIETFWIRCEYLKEKPKMSEEEFMTLGTDMDKSIATLNALAPKIVQMKAELKTYQDQEKELKEELYKRMTDNDIKKIDTPLLTVTRVLPSTSKRFDSTAFKKDHADLYNEYSKESERKGYVKLTAKE